MKQTEVAKYGGVQFAPVMKVEVETTTHIQDRTGRAYVRFTAVATFRPLASGELRFAFFDAWADDETNMREQREAAQAACRGAVTLIASEVQSCGWGSVGL